MPIIYTDNNYCYFSFMYPSLTAAFVIPFSNDRSSRQLKSLLLSLPATSTSAGQSDCICWKYAN